METNSAGKNDQTLETADEKKDQKPNDDEYDINKFNNLSQSNKGKPYSPTCLSPKNLENSGNPFNQNSQIDSKSNASNQKKKTKQRP